nr:MAG TPA: RNA polymerase I-like protein [Caudoviricetes sp.]
MKTVLRSSEIFKKCPKCPKRHFLKFPETIVE